MKRKYPLLLLLLLLLASFIPPAAAQNIIGTYALTADDGTAVGNMIVIENNGTVTVSLDFSTSASCLENNALQAWGSTLSYSDYHYFSPEVSCSTQDVFQFQTNGTDVFNIWVDYKLSKTEVVALPDDFGDNVTIEIYNGGSDSYLQTTVYGPNGELLGTYESWCIDLNHQISTNVDYTAAVYDGYTTPLPNLDNLANVQANIDLLNYIINQDYVASGYPAYEVQMAIWALTNPEILLTENYPLDYPFAQMILNDAYANGQGFEPTCGQLKGVVVAPTDGANSQHQFVVYPLICTPDSEWVHTYEYMGSLMITVDMPDASTPPPPTQEPTTPPPPSEEPSATPPTDEPGTPPPPPPTEAPTATPEPLGCQSNNPDRLDCSSLQVSGTCEGGTAVFTILNTGEPGNGDMRAPTAWRLVDVASGTLLNSGTVQIDGGQTLSVTYDGGGEVRLEADQQVGHPGNSHPNAIVSCSAE